LVRQGNKYIVKLRKYHFRKIPAQSIFELLNGDARDGDDKLKNE